MAPTQPNPATAATTRCMLLPTVAAQHGGGGRLPVEQDAAAGGQAPDGLAARQQIQQRSLAAMYVRRGRRCEGAGWRGSQGRQVPGGTRQAA